MNVLSENKTLLYLKMALSYLTSFIILAVNFFLVFLLFELAYYFETEKIFADFKFYILFAYFLLGEIHFFLMEHHFLLY